MVLDSSKITLYKNLAEFSIGFCLTDNQQQYQTFVIHHFILLLHGTDNVVYSCHRRSLKR